MAKKLKMTIRNKDNEEIEIPEEPKLPIKKIQETIWLEKNKGAD